MEQGTKDRFFKYLVFLMTCFVMENSLAQEMNLELKNTMQKISDAYAQEEGCMLLKYQQKELEGMTYSSLSECKLYKKEELERAIFEEYETLKNDQWYIKADHEAQKLYIIKFNEGDEMEATTTVPSFNEALLQAYQIKWDSTNSQLKNGILQFEGLPNSNYSGLEILFQAQSHRLKSYVINYKDGSMPGMKSLKIDFKKLDCSAEELKNAFAIQPYFSLENNEVKVASNYSNYQLIKNF